MLWKYVSDSIQRLKLKKNHYGQYGLDWVRNYLEGGGYTPSRVLGQNRLWKQGQNTPEAGEVLFSEKLTFAVK